MSQKKLKRLRKQSLELNEKKEIHFVYGIRKILRENWKFLLILCLATIAIYFNSLAGAFVSDDYASIPQNLNIMSFKNGFSGGIPGLINWFLAVTFGINNPVSFHIASLVLYLFIIIIGFVCLKLLFEDGVIPYLAIIIFVFLPIHVEAISWISGKPYLLNALFVLISMSLFIIYSKTEKKKYLYWFLISLPFTFFAEKVRSSALPILLILYWISFENILKKKINAGKILLVFGLLLFSVLMVLLPNILNRISTVNSGVNVSDSIYYNPFFQYPTAISKYLQLILFPTDLTLYHTLFSVPVWLNWSVIIVYLIAVIWFWFKDKKIFFALTFIFGAAAPSMAPVKVSWLVAERYMFLGSLGMALLLAIIMEKFWESKKIIVFGFMSILMAFYSVRIVLRNIDWQTNHNLWVNTCQVSPNSHNAWNNIGDDYDKLAQQETTESKKAWQYGNAIKGFAQSFTVKPNYADAYHNQANIFYKIGRYDLAKDGYETALSYNPNLYQTYYTLIQIEITQKDYQSAMDHLNRLNEIKPNDPQVYYIAAVVYASTDQNDKAISILEQLIKVNPNWTQAIDLLNQVKQYKK